MCLPHEDTLRSPGIRMVEAQEVLLGPGPVETSTPANQMRSSSTSSPTPILSLSGALKKKIPAPMTPTPKSVLFASPPTPLTFWTQDELPRIPSALTPSPFFATPEFQKPKLLVNSLGHRTTAPTKAQLRAAAARERWEQHAEQRALQHQTDRADSLW